MHMADALISPVVGGIMLAAAAGITVYCTKKISKNPDEKKIPLMGVMGAFVFAAQMINFSILGTGSSGHLGGGLLLSVILGPYAGFLTMVSVLVTQALFFADGGLLALGCNIINLGFYTCFIAYPLIYKKIIRKSASPSRILTASVAAAVAGLQLGAFSVVLQTFLSGKTDLPFGTFALVMQLIHLVIGVVEGYVTGAVAIFIWKTRPEIMESAVTGKALVNISVKRILVLLVAITVFTGGFLSWFASSNPDGLEWSIFTALGKENPGINSGVHSKLSDLQRKTAILPDYDFKAGQNSGDQPNGNGTTKNPVVEEKSESWPAANTGTSVSGLVGGTITLTLAALTGLGISLVKRKKKTADTRSDN